MVRDELVAAVGDAGSRRQGIEGTDSTLRESVTRGVCAEDETTTADPGVTFESSDEGGVGERGE